ncbi:MAG: putative sigma-E factor regulatory protein, partial [Proteobacteria bacterium]|nr:putative sigma-E factor regulatory protein [Pseudomonadota bacterium]
MHSIALLLAAVLALFGCATSAETALPSDAKSWLAATTQAMSGLNYHGMVAYLKDNRVESFKVFHRYADGVEQERLLSVNTPMREVVRNADTVTCYFPDSKSMSVENRPARQSSLLDLPNNLAELGKYYGFMLGAKEHIAQRLAQLVSIVPLDGYRYGRRLWIDLESKLPLRYELLDENEQVVEQMVFNSLTVDDAILASDLEPSTRPDATWKVKRHENLPADSLSWTMDRVPEGFRMISYARLLKRGGDRRTIDHILLSDGLSSVSVYIDQLMNDIFTAQPRKIGAINSYTRKIDNYLVTVMGEVPVKTVQAIGDG